MCRDPPDPSVSTSIQIHVSKTRCLKFEVFVFCYSVASYNLPAVCCGLIPTPSSVIIAEVAGGTLNSSAANFNTAVNGVVSGTLSL